MDRNSTVRDAKYELMIYLVEQGIKDLDALIALKADEAAAKFKGADSKVMDVLTQYVKGTRKRIADKGYFFPGVGEMKHASRISMVNGLRKYLARKHPETTLQSLGLAKASRRKAIDTPEDALAFLASVK